MRKTKQLNGNALSSKAICELVKRRLKYAGLPDRLSPHSFRYSDNPSAHSQRSVGGRALPGRAYSRSNEGPLRPAADEGNAEHRAADFDLMNLVEFTRCQDRNRSM